MKKLLQVLFVIIALTGCSGSPLTVFQKKVPPPLEKAPETLETERRAADLIANTIEKPEALKPVAKGLSASLGAPAKPIIVAKPEDLPKAAAMSTEELRASLVSMQAQITALNEFLVKQQGKEIEGTGFNMFGPGMATIIIGLIVLGVVFPPAFTLMAIAYKRMKAAASIVVNQIEQASKADETKEAVSALKEKIADAMVAHPSKTTALKATITNLKTA